jgi:protein-L-isoaspartate(D-aspartate) O-methyltransferase
MKHSSTFRVFTSAYYSFNLLLLAQSNATTHNNNDNNKSLAFQNHPLPPRDEPAVMRAWTCHGHNQLDLVDRLRQANIVQTPAVQTVLCQVDRVHYSPPNSNPYQDAPQVLGWGQTISAPHMHAHALEELYPTLRKQRLNHPNDPLTVLDVGCGSGYLTAALGRFFKAPPTTSTSTATAPLGAGFVHGIDIHPQLVQVAASNIRLHDADLLDSGVVKLQTANGWEGLPEAAPFDAIHVGASAADLPHRLAQQLKPGGVMIIPVGPQSGTQQYLYRVERSEQTQTPAVEQPSEGGLPAEFDPKEYRVTKLLGVRYVPLIQEPTDTN